MDYGESTRSTRYDDCLHRTGNLHHWNNSQKETARMEASGIDNTNRSIIAFSFTIDSISSLLPDNRKRAWRITTAAKPFDKSI